VVASLRRYRVSAIAFESTDDQDSDLTACRAPFP